MNSSSSFSCSSSSSKAFPVLKRRAIFRNPLRNFALLMLASILLAGFDATAETTNTLSDAEIQGRQLALQLCNVSVENSTNTGVLKIRNGKGKQTEIPVKCTVITAASNWQSIYAASGTNKDDFLLVVHAANQPNSYFYLADGFNQVRRSGENPFRHPQKLAATEIMTPFAGSDFWLADLGLEFFHWPEQKILKKEFRRNCSCAVMESINPNPMTNGYLRVVSWIDEDSLGIVMANAYDAQGKLLKEFYPKDIKKVKGQWQVQSLEINDVQTGSRTRLELDLKSP